MKRPDYRGGRVERTVKVYTVCDESRFLIVRNVPALGCINDVIQLFGLHGDIEECRVLDEEDCEPYTDVYWIKYSKYSNARYVKRKLDNHKFLGSLLEVSYGPNYETLNDTQDKLENRRRAVVNRTQVLTQSTGNRPRVAERPEMHLMDPLLAQSLDTEQCPPLPLDTLPQTSGSKSFAEASELDMSHRLQVTKVDCRASNQDNISETMNNTLQFVQEQLIKVSDATTFPSTSKQEVGEGHYGTQTYCKRLLEEDNLNMATKKRQHERVVLTLDRISAQPAWCIFDKK